MVRSREHIARGGWQPAAGLADRAGLDTGALLERAVWIGSDGVALVSDGLVRWANPALHAICSLPPDALVGAPVTDVQLCELDDTELFGAPVRLEDVVDSPRGRKLQLRRADGSTVAVAVSCDRIQATPGGSWVMRLREIANHIRVDEALRMSEARFRALADNAPIGVFLSDVGVRLAYVNSRFAQVWGCGQEELLGDQWLDMIIESDRGDALEAIGDVLLGAEREVVLRVLRPNGDVRTLDVQLVPVVGVDRQASFVGSVEDVTDARAREAALAWQARHDSLTGLPNRSELWDQIHNHVAHSDSPMTLLFFDLDDFKLVNDSLGHQAGDVLLSCVAQRLSDAVRIGDVVARFGGDEFVVFCPSISTESEAMFVAERLLQILREPVEIHGRQIRVTASAGVLVSDPTERDTESLIRDADVAMYQAKSAGKARAAVFDASARRMIEHRLDVVSDLRRALAEGEVEVYYQPIVRRDDLTVVAAEALLRYSHSTLGPIPANDVIEIAEASGVIDELGFYVLDKACADLAEWRTRMVIGRPEYITVNLAASQLGHQDFESFVRDTIDKYDLRPQDLCLELTESQLMTDVETAERVIGSLAGLGIRLAIDDFGTGYSSLAYLRRFPVSLVKIERSFVSDPHDPFVAAIVEAVVSVTKAIGGQVVAEGVETLPQMTAIGDLGCSLIQGYFISRPAPAESLPLSTDAYVGVADDPAASAS